LGEGACGKVFLVVDEEGLKFALKVMSFSSVTDNELENLEKIAETELSLGFDADLKSPFLVNYIKTYEEGDKFCILMELCSSGTLHDQIEEHIEKNTHFSELVYFD
jgi:serine/threonine protein kinase